MKRRTMQWVMSAAMAAFALPALAQTAPSTQAGEESMTAIVQAVEGSVRVRKSKDAAWEPAVVGMELHEGAEIRTGMKSAIRCNILPDQTFVLDRLSTLELTQSVRQGNLVKTDLTMKYGRAQYEIEKAGLEHDARITSPGSTLAVRGTIVELEDTPPFKPRAVSYTGRARFTAERRTASVGAPGGNKASIDAGQQNAAINALEASVIDPQSSASRTPADNRLIAQQVSLGAVARFDRDANITVIKGGPGPTRTEADLVASLPGELAFVARWTGNADINFQMGVALGDPAKTVLATGNFEFSEFIYPGFGLNVSKSGGRTDYDHRGGPNGGQEVIYWSGSYPAATYGLAAINVSGDPANVTINAYLKGKKIDLYDFAPFVPVTPEGTKSTSFTYTLNPGEIATPLVFLPLSPDHPFSSLPDANGGAPADLPDADSTTATDTKQAKKLAQKAAKLEKQAQRQQQKAERPIKTPKSKP